MNYTEETVEAQILGLSAMVTNAVRSLWDQALLLQQPAFFEAAKSPIHFTKDAGQIGQLAESIGFAVYTFAAPNEALQAQFPPFLYLGVAPAHAARIFRAVYQAQAEAVQQLEAYYAQAMQQLKQQGVVS